MTITELSSYMERQHCQIHLGTTRTGINISMHRLPQNKGQEAVARSTGATLLEALERLQVPEEAKL